MATNNLKFFHVAGLPSTGAVTGGIYFDKTAGELAVWNGTAWERYSGNVKNVEYKPLVDKNGNATSENGALTITYFNGDVVTLDFSQVASKDQVAAAKTAAVTEAKNYVNARKVNGKTLDTDITLTGADVKLDGYSKPASTSDIEATDTINQALGKLEAAIEDTGGNALTHVTAGAGIDVTNKNNHDQTISVKLDPASEKFGVGESAVPVLTASGDGLKISGIKNAIDTAIGNLDSNDAAVLNKYVSKVSVEGGKIKVARENLPVIGVADNDKILSLSGAKIGADLNFEYSTADKKIYLYGSAKNAAHKIGEVDCTAFIKDGMLDSASYNDSTHILTLTFNTDSGNGVTKKDDIEVDLSTLVDTYDAGDGLTLDKTGAHPTFKINLTEGGNYLGIVNGKLRLDETKIHSKISGDIETEIGKLNATKFNDDATGAGTDPSSQIKVTVSEASGVLTGVTVNAPIFALPADITAAENRLIGSDAVAKDSNTIWGAKKYADDIVAAAKTAVNTSTDNKIKDLNAAVDQNKDATGTFSTTGIKAQVVETAGKLTDVTVSIADGTYAKPADITAAIEALDSEKSNTASGAGADASTQIKVQVNQVNGKIDTVAVNAPAFDLSGAAADALKDAKAYTDEKIQGLDSTVSQAASETEGLALQVVEVDGKLTSVSGSMNWCQW